MNHLLDADKVLEFILDSAARQPVENWLKYPNWLHGMGVESATTYGWKSNLGDVQLAEHFEGLAGPVLHSLQWRDGRGNVLLCVEDGGPMNRGIAEAYRQIEKKYAAAQSLKGSPQTQVEA